MVDQANLENYLLPEPLLDVNHLKKYFEIRKGLLNRHVGDVKAVDDVSFKVYRRETLALVGESGCGKTTVGRCLVRAYKPTEGELLYHEPPGFEDEFPKQMV